MSKSSTFEDWLRQQNELAKLAKSLFLSKKIKARIVLNERNKIPHLLVFFDQHIMKFHLKKIRTRFLRNIWLVKKSNFSISDHFLVYCEKQEMWLYINGEQIKNAGELRLSEYHKRKEEYYYVVPSKSLIPLESKFKEMLDGLEQKRQKRIETFF